MVCSNRQGKKRQYCWLVRDLLGTIFSIHTWDILRWLAPSFNMGWRCPCGQSLVLWATPGTTWFAHYINGKTWVFLTSHGDWICQNGRHHWNCGSFGWAISSNHLCTEAKDHVHPRRKYVDVCVCGRLDACRASLKYRSYQMQSVWRSVGSQVAHYRLRVSDTETGQ